MALGGEVVGQVNAAFRYVIELNHQAMAAFTECTLPVIEWDIEDLKEGGLNTHVHSLLGQRKPARLTLKNGVGKTAIIVWFLSMVNEPFDPKKHQKSLTIKLKDALMSDICIWSIAEAYPIKWTGPQLQSDSTAVAIQTLEIACGEITVELK